MIRKGDSRRGLLKWVHPSACRLNEMGSLWMQLPLQFFTDLFETLQVFLSWSEVVHLVLRLSSLYFFINFFHFFNLFFFFFFQVRLLLEYVDTLWAQLLLEFSADHFETIHTYSTWSVDVHMVMGLSSRYFLSTFSMKQTIHVKC